jgi:hypothetical protein
MLRLFIVICFLFSACGVDESTSELSEAAEEPDINLNADIDASVDAMVRLGLSELRAKGFDSEANSLEIQYVLTYAGFLSNPFRYSQIGDHAPWSEWLVGFYKILVSKLGQTLVNLLHLDDLNIFNYAVTVVFDPTNKAWDIDEYRAHYVPLAGVVSYWITYATCTAATWSAGAVFLVCTPVGMAAERVTVKRIAPRMSDRVYRRRNA